MLGLIKAFKGFYNFSSFLGTRQATQGNINRRPILKLAAIIGTFGIVAGCGDDKSRRIKERQEYLDKLVEMVLEESEFSIEKSKNKLEVKYYNEPLESVIDIVKEIYKYHSDVKEAEHRFIPYDLKRGNINFIAFPEIIGKSEKQKIYVLPGFFNLNHDQKKIMLYGTIAYANEVYKGIKQDDELIDQEDFSSRSISLALVTLKAMSDVYSYFKKGNLMEILNKNKKYYDTLWKLYSSSYEALKYFIEKGMIEKELERKIIINYLDSYGLHINPDFRLNKQELKKPPSLDFFNIMKI